MLHCVTHRRRTRHAALVVSPVLAGLLVASCSSATERDAAASPAVTCSYPDSGDPARPVDRPSSLNVPATGDVPATLRTTAGEIGVTLSRDAAPCAVHSIENLVAQSYFVSTPCHRLTTPPADVFLLQCGDPTGSGAGGPGYVVPDEPPTGLPPAPARDDDADHSGTSDVIYPRGTIALANRGVPDSGGSQFFLVYRDSVLPPDFTVFGRIDDAALPVLDAIADGGTDDATAPGDGHPLSPVTIKAIVLPAL